MKQVLLIIGLILVLRLSPAPHEQYGQVHASSEMRFAYASQDSSFRIGPIAGCIPFRSCGLNEPTDWYIGLY